MALVLTVQVTLAHPLTPAQSGDLGLAPQAYPQGTTFTIDAGAAKRLVYAGMTTISPADHAAIAALFGSATAGYGTATAAPVFVGPDAPENPPERYVWFQTGLGDGTGITMWIEDGT